MKQYFIFKFLIFSVFAFNFSYAELKIADQATGGLGLPSGCNSIDNCTIEVPPPPKTYSSFISVPVEELHDDFLKRVFSIIMDKGVFYNSDEERGKPPFDFQIPEDLYNIIDFKLGVNGTSHDKLLEIVEKTIQYSPHTSHPYYLNRRSSGLDPYGLAAEWIAVVMNQLMACYLFGPVFSLMEMEVASALRKILKFPDDMDGIGGIPTIFSNGFALNLAMQTKYPSLKVKGIVGVGNPKLAVFVSEDGDYTTLKEIIHGGIGLEGLYKIKTINGRMDVNHLKVQINASKADGKIPILIIATAGTPILGAIDPINDIAQVATDQQIWFHVDGECGGALILSDAKKHMINGTEKADSFSWSPHCMLNAPFDISLFIPKRKDVLRSGFGLGDPVVFKTTNLYNLSYDIGDATVQTTRRPDIFKLWYMWKIKGEIGLAQHINTIYAIQEYAVEEIKKRGSKYKLILDKFDLPLVSFYFIPPELRIKEENSTEYKKGLEDFATKFKKALLKQGILCLSLSYYKPDKPPFFTLNLQNSAISQMDINYILDQIENIGEAKKVTIPRPPPHLIYPAFISAPVEQMHKEFLSKVIHLIFEKGLYFQKKRAEPALNFKTPEKLKEVFDFTLGLEGVASLDRKISIMDSVINYSNHQAHPYFVYQLFAGLDPYAIASDFLISAMQSPMITYEDSPVFTLMENEVLKSVRDMLGWYEGDGSIVTGGSGANIAAIMIARYYKVKELKQKGNNGKKLVYYVSKDAHYSLIKPAFYLGLGLENCILIEIDARARMSVPHLVKAIEKTLAEGGIPFMIAATAGTTTLGSIDPIDEIADVAKRFNLWYHIDGTFGGPLIYSSKHRERIKGFEKADSFNFNPTKMFASPASCTVFVTKMKNITRDAFALGDPLDFEPNNDLYDRVKWDPGDKRYQRVKRANLVKFWFIWKAKGSKGLGDHIDYIYDLVIHATAEMKAREGFEFYLPAFDITNFCFYYIPKRIRGMDKKSRQYKQEIENVGYKIQAHLALRGIVVVAQFENDAPLYLKFVLMSSGITKEDVTYLVKQVEQIGIDL